MYSLTVGIEVHAELRTKSKMFCDCKNDPDEATPNTNICPVCLAHPGTLPTINKQAVQEMLKVGTAIGGTIADYSEFDRKSYFYPDLPKAYQITQFEFPFVSGGELRNVAITRIHLEEDTARSIHDDEGGHSLIDFNRAGVPLMELVTEPVIHKATEAALFAKELQLLLRTLGVSDANMEKGEMRVEANISVSSDPSKLGVKVEVKNLNSFRAVEKAIHYEEQRQIELLTQGERVTQETRGWDDTNQRTFSQRVKEEAADYRYFPEPDLPKLKVSEVEGFSATHLRESLPELPEQKRTRLEKEYALPSEALEIYTLNPNLLELLDETAGLLSQEGDSKKLISLASNYIVNTLKGLENISGSGPVLPLQPVALAEVVQMAHAGEISSNTAAEALQSALQGELQEVSVREFVKNKGMLQENDPKALETLVQSIIEENPDIVEEIKEGKSEALQYLVGEGMKKSKGAANPAQLGSMLRDKMFS